MFTVADRAAEELIVRRIVEARPVDGIVSEEGTSRDGGPVRWIVDLLDGSANYLRGIPHFSVSIAAEIDGVTVAAAVFNPVVGEMFHAVLKSGAMLNGVAIRPSDERRLSHALVATGFGDSGAGDSAMQRQTLRLQAILPVVADLRRTGSAALDICWVACGRLDAYYEAGQYPWDVAAADLIAREAGGLGGTLDGSALTIDRTWVAANPHLFSAFRDLISSAAPDPSAS